MRESLKKIFELGYRQYGGKVLGEGSETRKQFKEFKEEIKKFVSHESLFTAWSPGQWRWAAIPWVRVYDKNVAPKTTSGVYIVYLFAQSGESVYLTLSQGVSNSSSTEIMRVKKEVQGKIGHGDFSVNYGTTSELGDYKEATIFYKEYKSSSLPAEEQLRSDLKSLIDIYKNYIGTIFNNGETSKSMNLPNDGKINKERSGGMVPVQKILFGAPGSGKSFKIEDSEKGYGLEVVDREYKFRTTFHPDYDYAQFVGAYKPKEEDGKITYAFVPQVFAKAYVKAWKEFIDAVTTTTLDTTIEDIDAEKVYLVIEEINRGNCAQIFGDIFQLLDRDDESCSQYVIDSDADFAKFVKEEMLSANKWNEYVSLVGEGKLRLTPNLNILATMNTSDQSLFPMDSAFKRRFDWEYVPIKYAKDSECGENWNADEFEIEIGNSKYKWLDFLEKVNADIYDATRSEDKQMGEFFIKPKDGKTISFEDFRSKVLFYLWDSVYKDETERQTVFHFPYGDGDDKIKSVTFQSLFGRNDKEIVNTIMENLKVEKVTA